MSSASRKSRANSAISSNLTGNHSKKMVGGKSGGHRGKVDWVTKKIQI